LPEDEALTTLPAEQDGGTESIPHPHKAVEEVSANPTVADIATPISGKAGAFNKPPASSKRKHASLATPAIRHLIKEHGVEITDIEGTGRDGRVLKEDVQKHIAARSTTTDTEITPTRHEVDTAPNRTISLTPSQTAMFKTMTRSLSIPHFLYTDTIDIGPINGLRRSLNQHLADSTQPPTPKLTLLPFLLKALSLTMTRYPILTALLTVPSTNQQPHSSPPSTSPTPTLTLRPTHNIGIAVDTPSGLLVPVVPSIQTHTITTLAHLITHLTSLARASKLKPSDLAGGIITVSNIGSIGGGVVSPIIVEGQVCIIGVGRAKVVPAFDAEGKVVKKEEVTLSWSADHRVVGGGTVARAAEYMRGLLEEPGRMLVGLR